ncbi:MAG TPA: hypothetical protein VEA63_14290 [Opitutus sp.]|nr:hypothetical protein [Opitutus sp.]
MRNPRTLARIAVLAATFTPVVALAHPGHDDHDFTWEFSHLAAHPVATLLCVTVLAAIAWTIWRFLRHPKSRRDS